VVVREVAFPMSKTPLPAATVMLVRDGAQSPLVLMLERHAKSTVLPDQYVFPGGRVDDEDQELAPCLGGWTSSPVPDLDERTAKAFFAAAIRETFEEAGILLARRRGQAELLDESEVAPLRKHRLAVQGGEQTFLDLVEGADLELAADALEVHARWITPVIVPYRFDTLFFTALAPANQLAMHDGVEAASHAWLRPEDALDEHARGKRQIIFPTARNLETLSGFSSAAEALEASRDRTLVTVLPVVEERDGERFLTVPEDAGYTVTQEPLERLLKTTRK